MSIEFIIDESEPIEIIESTEDIYKAIISIFNHDDNIFCDDINIFIKKCNDAGYTYIGLNKKGMPEFKGLCGCFKDKTFKGNIAYRYESYKVFDLCSR